jgi:LuxR family maltose regulon positive regulatory protein
MAAARLSEADGDSEAALESLASAAQHYVRGFFPEVRPIGGLVARIRIGQGRLDDARDWVAAQGLTPIDEVSYLSEFGHITLARLLIAEHRADPRGVTIDTAVALLDRLVDAAAAGRRLGSVNEILVLLALAHGASGQASHALASLERVLESAEPEGYMRLFVDEGGPMRALLGEASDAGVRPDYVRRLLQAFPPTDASDASDATDASTASTTALAVPLSDREAHVLRLLATELSGPEIARELYVSLNTLRTHTKHIFAKLDVNNRSAAVDRGTQLGLI